MSPNAPIPACLSVKLYDYPYVDGIVTDMMPSVVCPNSSGETIVKHSFCRCFAGLMILTMGVIVFAEDSIEELIKKDRKRIEGTWKVVSLEVNGNKSADEDARKLSVINGSDGTWRLLSEGVEISRGTSTIDPTRKPKSLDFTASDGGGKGENYFAIYELGENTRKMCFAPPGKDRPTEFKSTAESEHILVTFEREKVTK